MTDDAQAARIDQRLPFKPVRIAILTVSDTLLPRLTEGGA